MDGDTYNARLDAALTEWDLPQLQALLVESGVSTALQGFLLELLCHKVRVERSHIDPKLRLESIQWLKDRGYSRWKGLPWPPEGQLPE